MSRHALERGSVDRQLRDCAAGYSQAGDDPGAQAGRRFQHHVAGTDELPAHSLGEAGGPPDCGIHPAQVTDEGWNAGCYCLDAKRSIGRRLLRM